MKENRRNFIRKSAALAASVSVAGITSGIAGTVDPAARMEVAKKAARVAKDGGMEFSLMIFGFDSPRIALAKQMDVFGAVSGVKNSAELKPWDPKAILATKEGWEKLGMKWNVVEGPPTLGEKTKLGLEGRDEEISNFITFMKNLKQYGGVDIICYNWMPVVSWFRTKMDSVGRGGALVTSFDYEESKKLPQTQHGQVSKETLWKTLEYFLKAVVPEAEKIGMNLSLHPDLLGLLRVSQTLRGLLRSKPSPEEIEHTLCAIRDTPPRRSVRWQVLAAGCAGAAFCIVNGGDPVSWVCSFVAGAFIFAIRRPLAARNFNFHLTVFAIALGGSFLAGLLARLTQTATPLIALLAPVLFLVPGVPMINGGIDMVRNHVTIGIARVGFTLVVIVALCLGVGLTLPILPFQITPPFSLPDPLGIALVSAAGALGAGALALLNNGSLSIIALCALGGLTGRLVRGLLSLGGFDLITASLIGVVCSTLLVSLIAERLGWPTVVTSVMAALPMVPGYFAINGLHSLFSFATANFVDFGQLSNGLQALLRALFISVALVVGVIAPVTILQRDVERV